MLSRRKGEGGEFERRVVDVATGFGLEEGLAGADAVVDAVNDTKQAKHVLAEGTPKLVAAAQAAGVGHLLSMSIVGCDRVPIGYYKVKVAQEAGVEAGPVPWTILRATQFHQLLDTMLKRAARSRIAPAGRPSSSPSIPRSWRSGSPSWSARGPSGRAPEVTGPKVETLTTSARRGGRRGQALPAPAPGARVRRRGPRARRGRAHRAGDAGNGPDVGGVAGATAPRLVGTCLAPTATDSTRATRPRFARTARSSAPC